MSAAGQVLPGVRKIAVLRANGLGDYIFALPALAALRAAYPAAEIVLLAKRWHKEFLSGRPGPVDRVIVTPPSSGVNEEPGQRDDPQALDAFFAEMRAERFDLAIQLHGGGRNSNPFLLRLGARVTAGTRTPDAAPLDLDIPYIYFQREVLRYLEVVALVGARMTTLEPSLCVTAADRAEAAAVVPDEARPLVVLHPGAGDPQRRWPPHHFARVGDALAAAGACVAVIGTAGEREIVAAVLRGMHEPALDLCGRLSLGGLTGLLARAQLVISNDSGPLHLAGAVGAATIGIYWCFNLINAGPITTTRHRPFVSWQLICPICGLDQAQTSCGHAVSFVASVPVEAVTQAAFELLEGAQRTTHAPV